ncbi:MAG: ABC transporter substrate-binding protein [Candidatus Bathyarchaeota archaeon]|nr:MAG: ABC transporter substrate-binding protein [Candidatus Bathyarchaeota archaeon]
MNSGSRVKTAVILLAIVVGCAGVWWIIKPPTSDMVSDEPDLGEEGSINGTISIGVISPTSADFPVYEFIVGVAERDINAHFNESGTDIRFEFVTSCADADVVPGKVDELTQWYHAQGIDLVVGYGWSTVLCMGTDYAEENGMVIISPFSPASSEHLIRKDSTFRLYPHEAKLARPLAGMVEDEGVTSVVILQRDDSWGDAVAEEFRREYDGGEIVETIRYPPEIDGEAFGAYTSELWYAFDDIEEDREHRGVVLLALDEAVDIFDEADCWTQLVRAPWFWVQNTYFWDEEMWQVCSEEIISRAGYTAAKARLFSPEPQQPETEAYKRLCQAFSAEYGEAPRLKHSTLYDACWIMALSVIEADSSRGTAVERVLPDVAGGYTGASGRCFLDENGDRESVDYDIWGFIEEDGSTERMKLGAYFYESDEVEMYFSLLHPLEEIVLEEGVVYVGAMSSSDGDFPEFEFLVGMAEREINAHCRSEGLSTEFRFLLNSARGHAIRAMDDIQIYHKIGVDLVVGSLWTSQLCACRSYALYNGMILVSSSSSSPHLSLDDCVFRLVPNDNKVAIPIAKSMLSLGVEEVVILQRGDSWADGVAEEFTKVYNSSGGSVAGTIRYPSETWGEGLRQYLDEAEARLSGIAERRGVDGVGLLVLSFSEASELLERSGDHPTLVNVTWFGSDGAALSPTIQETAIEEAARVKLISPMAAISGSPTYDKVKAEYETRFGEPLDIFAANIYDACWVTALSVIEAGSANGADVIVVLPDVAAGYTGASGRCLLDEYGDRLGVDYALWGCFEVDGAYQCLRCGTYCNESGYVIWDESLISTPGGD